MPSPALPSPRPAPRSASAALHQQPFMEAKQHSIYGSKAALLPSMDAVPPSIPAEQHRDAGKLCFA
eukprot:2584736-Rhodomonas_salina.1